MAMDYFASFAGLWLYFLHMTFDQISIGRGRGKHHDNSIVGLNTHMIKASQLYRKTIELDHILLINTKAIAVGARQSIKGRVSNAR